MKFLVPLILTAFILTSCQSNGSGSLVDTLNVSEQSVAQSGSSSFISPDEQSYASLQPRVQKTYLINGLASAVPFIGYGFTNLSKKIEGGRLFSYISPVEGSLQAAPAVMKDILAAHAQNPDVEINLIGISYGANLVSRIAIKLHRKNIPVHYLGTIEGTHLKRIPPNVRTADNFTCTFLDCTRATARLARGNQITQLNSYKFKSSHIPLGDNREMHNRVLRQIAAR
ncbi:MAG: hypothetical protein QM488_08295 [Rhizobiaceae bacterium]